MGDANCFLVIRLELKTSVNDMNVIVVSTVTGQLCNNITRVQQARLLASQGCVRFARRPPLHLEIFQKIHACSHVSIVRLVQFTIPVSSDRHSHSSPLYHFPSELVSLSSVPMRQASISICGIVHVPALSSRYHSDSHQT